MKGLVIGSGEVGTALYKVLKNSPYETFIRDKSPKYVGENFNVLHICFPYFDNFIETVCEYDEEYRPSFIVVHSTVPIGTSNKLRKKVYCRAFHSPIRGVHPNLIEGILTFPKYLAPSSTRLKEYFEQAGIKIIPVAKTGTTEAAKLLDTTYYGWNIMFEKEVHKFCEMAGVDFDIIYTHWNQTYNSGYTHLGMPHVSRPVLKHMEGEIGGHCVINNAKLLNIDINKFLLEKNEEYKK